MSPDTRGEGKKQQPRRLEASSRLRTAKVDSTSTARVVNPFPPSRALGYYDNVGTLGFEQRNLLTNQQDGEMVSF